MPLTPEESRKVLKYALGLRRLSKGVKIRRPIEPVLDSVDGVLQDQRIAYKRRLLELVGDCGYTPIRRILEHRLPGKIPDLKDKRATIMKDTKGLGWITECRGWFKPDFSTGVEIDTFVTELLDAAQDAQSTPSHPSGQGLAGKTGSKARKRMTKPADEHAKPRGRPRKHTDAKCRKALRQFTDFYAESNDSIGAWSKVADNLDFKSGEAARKACERYQRAQNTGQNGQN